MTLRRGVSVVLGRAQCQTAWSILRAQPPPPFSPSCRLKLPKCSRAQGRLSQTVAGVACVDAGAHMKMTPAGSASGTWFTIDAMGSPSPSGGRSECTNPPPVNLRLSVSLGPAGVRWDAGTT